MIAQFEAERRSLEAFHAHEFEDLQEKTETTFRENEESQSLRTVKNQATISNTHLWECQLEYLSQVNKLLNYENQSKALLPELASHRKVHEEVEVALQQVIRMQKENPIPPPSITKLEKDDMTGFERILKSQKSEDDLVKSLLDQDSDLVEGVWDSFSDILEEWVIREIEKSLDTIEFVAPKIEAVNM